jgi:hypothetical protein
MDRLIKRLIIFLIRKKLGVKKWDDFYFPNQRIKQDRYYFADTCLMKYSSVSNTLYKSSVSLNHLLSKECEVIVDNEFDWTEKILDKYRKPEEL